MAFRSLQPDAVLADGLSVAAGAAVIAEASRATDGTAERSAGTAVMGLVGTGEMQDSAIMPEKSNPSGARRIAKDM